MTSQIKYKLREEKIGAMLFDNEKGAVTKLNEEQYKKILAKHKEFNYLFDKNGPPSFELFKSKVPREELPSDCLSAPSKVYFELTRKCNLNCKYCYNRSTFAFSNELSKEKIFSLLNELREAGVFEVRFTGGEPTMHKYFWEIVNYADKLGFFISLGTNGMFDDNTLEKIKESNIKIIILSLDGPKEYNDSVRGAGSFDKVVSNIRKLREKHDLMIKVNCVLTRDNKDFMEDLTKIAVPLGVNVLNFVPIKFTGRAKAPEIKLLTKEDMLGILSKIKYLREKYKIKIQTYFDILEGSERLPNSLLNQKNCGAGIEVAAISPFGEIYGCVVSPANELEDSETKRLFTAGNLKEDNFMGIWLDSKRWIFRDLKKVKSKECLKCNFYIKKCFGNCSVDSYLNAGKLNAPDPYCFAGLLKNG